MVGTLDTEVLEQVRELVEEDVDSPERAGLVLEVGGEAVAELVVENDGAVISEINVGEEVVVGEAGTAVEDDDRGDVLCGEDAVDLVIGLISVALVCEGGEPLYHV